MFFFSEVLRYSVLSTVFGLIAVGAFNQELRGLCDYAGFWIFVTFGSSRRVSRSDGGRGGVLRTYVLR